MAHELIPDALRNAVAVGVILGGLGDAPDRRYIGVPRFADLDSVRIRAFAHTSEPMLPATALGGGLTGCS